MKTIEYYYALASPWSFLGNGKLLQIAERFDLTIDPIIIDYDEMFEAAETVPLPRRPRLRKQYRLIDLKRWGDFRKIPINAEPKFYEGEVEEPNEREAALMVVAAKLEGLDSLKLAHAISRALWVEERFPFVREELITIANAEGFEGEALLEKAHEDATVAAYSDNTQASIERGAFGMPFYIVDEEPYWGQDRLELLEHRLANA